MLQWYFPLWDIHVYNWPYGDMAGPMGTWPVLWGHGWSYRDMAGPIGTWLVLWGHGWSYRDMMGPMGGHGWSYEAVAGPMRQWLVLWGSGWSYGSSLVPFPSVKGSAITNYHLLGLHSKAARCKVVGALVPLGCGQRGRWPSECMGGGMESGREE